MISAAVIDSDKKSDTNALSELIAVANSRKNSSSAYSGEVTPLEAYKYLAQEGGILVDVRTLPEWQFVGVPDLSGCKGKMLNISWKIYPEMSENPSFSEQIAAAGADKNTPLFFLCRGGGRSQAAAQAMALLGYSYCFNIATGFEGDGDSQGHRGRISGWQGGGLPWKH